MAVKAEGLLVTLLTVVAGLARYNPMAAYPVGVMVKGYTFSFVAGVTLLDLHFGVFGV
ncbi:MAG: hypothetical protein PVSMB11_02210 [Desulfuromonadaceae bacterium]